jgi:hypothetical protein
MTNNLGDFDTSAVVYGKFTTFRPSTGASFTLGGTPALSVYKDNSTTQSTTGVTLTADFDSVTGLNHFAIDTSADGTFYSAGSFFNVVITTGTVDSVSVTGAVVGSFTLRKNSALKPTTAGRTLDVSAGGEAGLDWANVGSPTTTLALTGTTIATTQKVDVETIKTNPVVNAGTVTFPTTATLASTTNITAGTVTTATNVTTVNGLAANVITAAATAADFGTEVGTAVWATAARTLTAATNITSTGGSVPITAGGLVSSDVTAISTDTTAANNAESFFDGTGYAGTNNVIPTVTTVTNLTNAPTAGDFTATMKTSIGTAVAASAVASVTGNVGGNVVGSVGSVTAGVTVTTNNDKTGYALSSAGVQAIWDALTSALTTVGSIGKLLVDNINATISSRLASASYTAPLDAAGTRSALGLASANLDTQLAALPTASENAAATWDESLAGHLSAGSTGEALNAAGAAGDPWTTSLPGAYGAGSAGYIIGTNLNATVSSRASQTTADAIETDTQDIQSRLPAALTGGGNIKADILAISGDTTAADNCELMFDGTGYAGGTTLLNTFPQALGTTAVAQINATVDTAISDAALATAAALAVVDGIVDDILVDTGTTIPAQIAALNNVSSSDVQTAAAAALTAYDPPTKAEMDSSFAALNNISAADVLAAGDIDGYSLEQAQKLQLSAMAGKASGLATTTAIYRAADDSKARITATVDEYGNRTAVTLDATG